MNPSIKQQPLTDQKPTTDGRGHFFAIDYRAWQMACDLGLNAAVCYLLLGRGTLKDNRTTCWSVHATENWTGISRPKARAAIDALIASGLVENLNNSLTRPRRRLVPAHLLPQIGNAGQTFTKAQDRILANLPMAMPPVMAADTKAALNRLIELGVVRFNGSQYVTVDSCSEEPDWIWLPNSLIDGAADETPPIEQIRKGQEVSVLRLLIDLYHAHSLSYFGGIPTSLIKMKYDGQEIAHQREFRIWRFEEDKPEVYREAQFFQPFLKRAAGSASTAGAAFWAAFEVLQGLGYVHFVGHVFEGAGADAEIIHPLDYRWFDDRILTEAERSVGQAARRAAVALLPDFHRPRYFEDDIIPVRNHIRAVEMRGVARLLYRPRTMVTAQWFALSRRWEREAAAYKQLVDKLPPVEPF